LTCQDHRGGGGKLEDEIVRLILSKKFRKYAANDALISQIKQAIHLGVTNHEPINFTFLGGAYKLWRLGEAPEADWGELFALMYYSEWLKPICGIYKPGVWFDWFADDTILERLNNISRVDTSTYIKSYQVIMDFLKPYQPKNLRMTMTTVGSRFKTEHIFWQSVERNLANVVASGLPVLTDSQKVMIELNVKPTNEQLKDPKWREKNDQLHNAYSTTKAEIGYYKGQPNKIAVFPNPLPDGMKIAVGTTKNSIAKFWMGVGVLKPKGENFEMTILSPNQLAKTNFDFEPTSIKGLTGKNFTSIRVIK